MHVLKVCASSREEVIISPDTGEDRSLDEGRSSPRIKQLQKCSPRMHPLPEGLGLSAGLFH